MTTEQQIKALAELDGYKWDTRQPMQGGGWMERDDKGFCWCDENYLDSYDAIMPVIQKQTNEVKADVWFRLGCVNWGWLDATPTQLCEALLRATGKWEGEQ